MLAASRRLGDVLVERKALSRDQLAELLAREADSGIPLAKLVKDSRLVSERDLMGALAGESGYRFVDLSLVLANPAVTALVGAEVAWANQAIPVDIEGDGLVVAMADPTDAVALDALRREAGMDLLPALAERRDLVQALEETYGLPPGARGGEGARGGGTGPAVPDPSRSHSPPEGVEDAARRARMPTLAEFEPTGELHLDDLLRALLELGGSDLHLTAAAPPSARIDGHLVPMTDYPLMNSTEIRRMLYAVLTQRQRERFEEELELDTSHSIASVGRFRVNVFIQRNSIGAVIRAIPFQVVPFEKLGLPDSVKALADLPRGLVLVTGPTGSGKSTTLASLVDLINQSRPVHIMTVEDPIEFLHRHGRALINQREIGEDTHSFAQALRHVLRQDPDVILVGEMRDLETISAALTAAETGHLVLGTLHTQDAPQSVDRIIDVFPSAQQTQIRVQLAAALQGIVTQQLVPRATGHGRAAAAEVLIGTPAVRNLIREGKTHQIYSAMQAGGQYGMQTMDMALAALVKSNAVAMPMAIERCSSPSDLRRLIQGEGPAQR
ncbi:MAG: PilT/PilU family type 4a pilus ATPase [Actinomycetota bacterium]|nr:PilT/PilU family type 4a pilus ATPase [Actinomycetota bacterium]